MFSLSKDAKPTNHYIYYRDDIGHRPLHCIGKSSKAPLYLKGEACANYSAIKEITYTKSSPRKVHTVQMLLIYY